MALATQPSLLDGHYKTFCHVARLPRTYLFQTYRIRSVFDGSPLFFLCLGGILGEREFSHAGFQGSFSRFRGNGDWRRGTSQ